MRSCKGKVSELRYRRSEKGRLSSKKSQYRRLYPQATQEDLSFYLAATNCELCNMVFDDNKHRKCQDHCHDTGQIRGVICSRCNTLEGILSREPELIWFLQSYKEKYNA